MSLGWIGIALCIVLTLLFRARAAARAAVVHAARPATSPQIVAWLLVLAIGVHAHRDAALARSPATTIADMPSTASRIATPPLTEPARRSDLTWYSPLRAQHEVPLRAPPSSAG